MSGKVLPIFAGLRRVQVLPKCGFLKALLYLYKFACRSAAEWLTDFETPTSIKRDPNLNNYLTQTMENNADSGLRQVQAEMSFIFIFPSIIRTEKTCVVF